MAEGGGVAGPRRAGPLGPGDPASVGPYQLVGAARGGDGHGLLGRGGDGELVAVKVLVAEPAADLSFLRMFRTRWRPRAGWSGSAPLRVLDAEPSGRCPTWSPSTWRACG